MGGKLTPGGMGRTFFERGCRTRSLNPLFLMQNRTKADTVADLLEFIKADGPANSDEQLLAEIIDQADSIEKAQEDISNSVGNIWQLMFSWMDKRRAV